MSLLMLLLSWGLMSNEFTQVGSICINSARVARVSTLFGTEERGRALFAFSDETKACYKPNNEPERPHLFNSQGLVASCWWRW
jgi:hypothetical protein